MVDLTMSDNEQEDYEFDKKIKKRIDVERNQINCLEAEPLSISHATQNLYMSDCSHKCIIRYNLIDSTTQTFDMHHDMTAPWALIFDDSKKHLYVGDFYNPTVCVYRVDEYDFEQKDLVKIKSVKINEIKEINSFQIDSANDLLYISDTNNDSIATLGNFEFAGKKSVMSPSEMKLNGSILYVTSVTYADIMNQTKKKGKHGMNCIYAYDRFNWTIQRTIRFYVCLQDFSFCLFVSCPVFSLRTDFVIKKEKN
jgi:hypothetical protein